MPGGVWLDAALIALPFGIIGARAYYVLLHPDLFGSVKEVFALRDGGLGIYGGVLLALAAGLVYARVTRRSFIRLCDLALPCAALGQAIGRWGNFINQEAYGVEMSIKALRFFPASVYISSSGTWHAATFFYESLWCLFIFMLVCVLPTRRYFVKKGAGMLGYLTLYAIERAFVEGLRTDSLYLLGARASQLLSILILAACAAAMLSAPSGPRKPRRLLLLCLITVLTALAVSGAFGLLGKLVLYLPLALLSALSVYLLVGYVKRL